MFLVLPNFPAKNDSASLLVISVQAWISGNAIIL